MEKRDKIKYSILLSVMFFGLMVIFLPIPFQGYYMRSDGIEISYDNILSGDQNVVNIKSNFSIMDINVYLNETIVEFRTYNTSDIMNKLPTDVYEIKGTYEGSISDLENINGLGLNISSKKCSYCLPCWKYYGSVQIIIFDLSGLEDATDVSLKAYLSSNDEFLNKIYYYNHVSEDWNLINQEEINSSNTDININFPLTTSILEDSSLVLALEGFNKHNYFNYLLDEMAIEYSVPQEFEDDINLDVSGFIDGYYVLKVEILDFDLNVFENESIVAIDNTAPILNIIDFPANGSVYNDTDIINFNAQIDDFSETNTILSIEVNGSNYMVLNFANGTEIAFQNKFLPGSYSYAIISQDSNGLISSYFGEFEVVLYETLPEVITETNTIYISIPSSVNNDVEDYYVYAEILGNVNNEYLCNITYTGNGTLADNFTVWTNSSGYSLLNIFNTSFTLDIYNVNNSYSLAFTKDYTVIKYPDIEYYNVIKVSHPISTYDSGYNIEIYLDSDDSAAVFEYKITNIQTNIQIDADTLDSGVAKEVYADIFSEVLLVEILKDGVVVYSTEFVVKYVPLPEEEGVYIDYNLIFVIISVASLMLGIFGTIYSILKGKSDGRSAQIIPIKG